MKILSIAKCKIAEERAFAFRLLLVIMISGLVTVTTRAANDTMMYRLDDMGIVPNTGADMTPLFARAIARIKANQKKDVPVSIKMKAGRYNFFPQHAIRKKLFISNHDQDNPKTIGLAFEGLENITFDGGMADLIFHGRMLPVSMEQVKNFKLKNLRIDFDLPHICQAEILENDSVNNIITLKTSDWVKYKIRDSVFYNQGSDWELNPSSGIAFDKTTRHIVYNTSDLSVALKKVVEVRPGVIKAFGWKNKKLAPGMMLAMRSWHRPAPGIFLDHGKNVFFENITVHYAEGMGLLAQVSEDVTLNHFNVALKGAGDPRYFTTQADATHFSGCKGIIKSVNGLYEAMMDDAINVHGTYLKVVNQKNDKTIVAQYMHGQSYGFEWGLPKDQVQLVRSQTMEVVGNANTIRRIRPLDQPTVAGAKQFEIEFTDGIEIPVADSSGFGIENMTWTPEVYFGHNTIRNNRARGSLFSTPRKTVVENNTFDHTSGSAILLCGDCNGWYETAACRSVIIRNNRFINALTNMFQFTNAIISIYPEIPRLKDQKKYFHSGIIIEHNSFETFDRPLVYAKSVDGLLIRNNQVKTNQQFRPFHPNRYPFLFERVKDYKLVDNQFDYAFDPLQHIKVTLK